MRLGLAAFLFAIAGATPAQAAGIALVLAVDVSESVSSDRYILQHDGIARAFEAPQLVDATATFDHMPEPAGHRVIDVSGDGMANFGVPPSTVRDELVKAGITINGLAILSEEPWLEDYYSRNVIGGPAAFVVAAKGFDSFADAMLRKLVQEVARGPSVTDAEER